MTDCKAKMKSTRSPGHTHQCIGKHTGVDHFCGECRTWWYKGQTNDGPPPKTKRYRPRKKVTA